MGAADVVVVGFGTNGKWSSKMIRRATNSWCSHTWIEYSSTEYGAMNAIHAQPEGVVKQRVLDVWNTYPKSRRYELTMPPQDIRLAIRYAVERLGTPYDYGALLNAMKLWWWRETSVFSKPRRNPRELHCSELVSLVLAHVDVVGADLIDPELTTPGQLWRYVEGHRQFREV